MLAISTQSAQDRDEETLVTLLRRVPVLSLEQVALGWWLDVADPERVAEKRIRRLERRGLVRCFSGAVPAEALSEGPPATWEPGDQEPHFHYVAGELERRSAEPTREALCIVPTE